MKPPPSHLQVGYIYIYLSMYIFFPPSVDFPVQAVSFRGCNYEDSNTLDHRTMRTLDHSTDSLPFFDWKMSEGFFGFLAA